MGVSRELILGVAWLINAIGVKSESDLLDYSVLLKFWNIALIMSCLRLPGFKDVKYQRLSPPVSRDVRKASSEVLRDWKKIPEYAGEYEALAGGELSKVKPMLGWGATRTEVAVIATYVVSKHPGMRPEDVIREVMLYVPYVFDTSIKFVLRYLARIGLAPREYARVGTRSKWARRKGARVVRSVDE